MSNRAEGASAVPAPKKGALRISSILDRPVNRLHHLLFTRHRGLSLALSIAAYAAIVLSLGGDLAISNNYFVALPVLVAALGFSVPGGLAAGALGLPANLLLFHILGHPEYSPASKLIAECFGTVLGFSLGYVAHNFRMYETELRRRSAAEGELTEALQQKDILLKELNHRVKNNLSVIKSIAQLQRARSADPVFLESIDRLVERIHAIALVHEQLYGPKEGAFAVDPESYLDALVGNLSASYADMGVELIHTVRVGGRLLDPEEAAPLGLIVNEALNNSIKHAVGLCRDPVIYLELEASRGEYRLVVGDNGPGFDSDAPDAHEGLGLKMIRALARQMDATLRFEKAGGEGCVEGARLELRWPIRKESP
ncbi:MAG TPA: sensor histidine kinase [Rectinemataceae bacterium]|nr:sensor histidine kinase [Rectinemataceae bacterium]